jgi:hypothetical protein
MMYEVKDRLGTIKARNTTTKQNQSALQGAKRGIEQVGLLETAWAW